MRKRLFLAFISICLSISAQAQNNEKTQLDLMPWPKEIETGSEHYKIDPTFTVNLPSTANRDSKIYQAATRFLRYMTDKTGVFLEEGFPRTESEVNQFAVLISFDAEAEVKMGIDESYDLKISDKGVVIQAQTDVGAMHALSTLLQLVEVVDGNYGFPEVSIHDEPRFVWRGLMMDVSRHFMPVDVVKRHLDAMAFVKLNVFHWHLSDDQGFRLESRSLPKLQELASDGLYYTHDQVKDIVEYATNRGIRVVPEIDVPGHATAFLTAYPELASKKSEEYSIERNAGIFHPTLDPTNEKTYEILDILFQEMAPLFPGKYFHIGGDENEGKHWDENESIQAFMKKHKLKDNHELQTYFNIKLEKILAKYGKSLMGWEEIMTDQMPTTALIHSWKGVNEGLEPGASLVKAAKNGYQTILSNGYYIDLLLSVKDHYLVDPMPNADLTDEEKSRILGGEATMWSELVTPLTIDSRVWPRTAAIAERFWSPSDVKDLDKMFQRLDQIELTLELIGMRHLQVKAYLLRNISNYQDTHALKELTEISEPFKIYSRNAGGTQYQTYSPFTLFADACTADAKAARTFSKNVDRYLMNKEDSNKRVLVEDLSRWSTIYQRLTAIADHAPLTKSILPYAKRVEEISNLCLKGLNSGQFTKDQVERLNQLLETKEDPAMNLDVELAISKDLMRLADFLASN